MTTIHNLGFPRIGTARELKRAVEAYWAGNINAAQLEQTGRTLRERHWQLQADKRLDLIPVGDFSWYDTLLDMSATLGAVPSRFNWSGDEVNIDTYFRMARGRAPSGEPIAACKMTKWFDTNYHYIVPEIGGGTSSSNCSSSQACGPVPRSTGAGHSDVNRSSWPANLAVAWEDKAAISTAGAAGRLAAGLRRTAADAFRKSASTGCRSTNRSGAGSALDLANCALSQHTTATSAGSGEICSGHLLR